MKLMEAIMEEKIIIDNCNCIKHGEIHILEGKLNIKYGSNGIGKSTIGNALKSNEEKIKLLKPYNIDENDKSNQPRIKNFNYSNVMVFNDDYINKYLFTNDSFFDDSFKVLLKNDECDKITKEINEKLSALQGFIQETEDIRNFREFLPQYLSAVKAQDGNIVKRGGVKEMLEGDGGGFDRYKELSKYKNYYSKRKMSDISSWAKWRNDGIKQIHGEECPFCMVEFEKKKMESQNTIIKKVFKNSALSVVNAVISYLEEAVEKGYVSKDSVIRIKSYIGENGKEDDMFALLQRLANETHYLISKMKSICDFRPMNVNRDDLKNIEKCLNEMEIDKNIISSFYNTTKMANLLDKINKNINVLKNKTGDLKGLFLKYESKIEKIVSGRKEDINEFFSIAGFPYQFEIKEIGENKIETYLVPNSSQTQKVNKPEEHLSWGEKNSFSLVMFMFEAISKNSDLIILDDPISSFDKNKKFAVCRRLFDNKKDSLSKRTVLMFTHDFQPIIDYLYNEIFIAYGIQTNVNAAFLTNEESILKEQNIVKNDIINSVILANKIYSDKNEKTFVRIVNRRKYIELTNSNYSSLPEYEIISNLIHGRPIPKNKNEEDLTEEVISDGMKSLCKSIDNYTYEEFLKMINYEELFKSIDDENSSNYEKSIAIRLIFERAKLLIDLRRKYPGACKFINETNHIENDYIFQLDPNKFFDIPELYIQQLKKFLKDKKNYILNL